MVRQDQAAAIALGMLIISWLPGPQSTASAQQAIASETPVAAWYEYYRQRAAQDYELVWSDEKKPLSLRSQAILNWTNPLEGGKINGSTFVWERHGRPIVVGQFFSYLVSDESRSFCHVFSTLTDEPVRGLRAGKTFWNPKLGGKSGWHFAKDMPAPSSRRALRLTQMRTIARRFKAYTEESTRGKRNLRFLSQPLYRYDESNEEADGGLFAYVVGNDPELLVLVECSLKPDEPAWRHRFAQSTKSTTVATLSGVEVYRYDNVGDRSASPDSVYLSRHGVETIPSVLRGTDVDD